MLSLHHFMTGHSGLIAIAFILLISIYKFIRYYIFYKH